MAGMSEGLQPLETRYKGYRFRSRLEARWAIFFDKIGVEWEYEKQGYNVNGTWYLPDFWLPYQPMRSQGWGHWIEIKPIPLEEGQIRLLAELARLTGHRTLALCGQPWPGEHNIYVFQHHHHGIPDQIPSLADGEIIEVDSHKGTEFEGMGLCLRVASSTQVSSFVEGYRFWGGTPGGLERAFRAAREARFEHGENPGM